MVAVALGDEEGFVQIQKFKNSLNRNNDNIAQEPTTAHHAWKDQAHYWDQPVMRSSDHLHLLQMSVPFSKTRTMDDNPGIDLDQYIGDRERGNHVRGIVATFGNAKKLHRHCDGNHKAGPRGSTQQAI